MEFQIKEGTLVWSKRCWKFLKQGRPPIRHPYSNGKKPPDIGAGSFWPSEDFESRSLGRPGPFILLTPCILQSWPVKPSVGVTTSYVSRSHPDLKCRAP